MAIRDVWLNPMASGTYSVLGYREDIEEFPHDIYSYFLSSIRELDVSNVRLLWRWLQGMQHEFESIYGKILNLPTLLSPDYCPEENLDYLKEIVGITDDLNYLWGILDTNEKRRLIKYFVRYLIYKSTPTGIVEILENMTGKSAEIVNFFNLRWIVSGDLTEMETSLGRFDEGVDPHLITDYETQMSRTPDSVSVVTVGTNQHYEFTINTLYDEIVEAFPQVRDDIALLSRFPKYIRVFYRPSNSSTSVVVPITSLGYFVAHTPANYFFGQDSSSLSTNKEDFRVGWDCDAYVFDINIEDPDGSLDHAVVEALATFFRPISERIYIRYYSFIEKFSTEENWSLEDGDATYDSDARIITIGDTGISRYRLVIDGSDDWSSYAITVKVSLKEYGKYFEIRWNVVDDDNYLYFNVTPGTPPHLPAGEYEYGDCIGGVRTAEAGGPVTQMDIGVEYVWRIVCLDGRINPDTTDNLIIEAYQDEVRMYKGTILSPTTQAEAGTIELVSEAGNEIVVGEVKVHPFPMQSSYIGL